MGLLVAATASSLSLVEAAMKDENLRWLRQYAAEIISGASLEQADPYHEGRRFVSIKPGGGYGRIYLADYVHACESRLVPAEQMRDAIEFLVPHYAGNYLGTATGGWSSSRREPSESPLGPDRPLPKEGWTEENPQFLVKAVWLHWKLSGDLSLFRRHHRTLSDYLVGHTGFYLKENGLVYFDKADVTDKGFHKRGYGFYDTVHCTGYNLFASLLFWEACTQLREMYAAVGDGENAEAFFDRAHRVASSLVPTFLDEGSSLLLASTEANRQPDVWGSAYAVVLGALDIRYTDRLAKGLTDLAEASMNPGGDAGATPGIVWRGQVRHMVDPKGWQSCDPKVSPLHRYQNGAYWGTATGWLFQAVRRFRPSAAERLMTALIADFRARGAFECAHPVDDYTKAAGYVSTVTLPLAALVEEGYYADATPLLSLRPTRGKPKQNRFGVNSHCFTPNETKAMDDLGLGWFVKHLFTWKDVERERGQYCFPLERIRYLNELTARGVRVIHPLCYNNGLYPDGPAFPWGALRKADDGSVVPPFFSNEGVPPSASPEAEWIRAFGEYAYQTVSRFGSNGSDQIRHWMIWGEPNGYGGERAGQIAKPYVALVREAARRIREADPDAKVIGCGMSRVDFRFLEGCLRQGITELVDFISIHPYRETTFPEDAFRPGSYGGPSSLRTYEQEIEHARRMVADSVKERGGHPERDAPPFVITEIGWRGGDKHAVSVPEKVQVKYLVRSLLLNVALDVRAVCWYVLLGDGFAVTWADRQWNVHPRLSYHPMRRTVRLFDGDVRHVTADRLLPEDARQQGARAHLFRTETGYRLAFWLGVKSTEEQQIVRADVALPRDVVDGRPPPEKVRLLDLVTGGEREIHWQTTDDGWLAPDVLISDTPSVLAW